MGKYGSSAAAGASMSMAGEEWCSASGGGRRLPIRLGWGSGARVCVAVAVSCGGLLCDAWTGGIPRRKGQREVGRWRITSRD